MRAPLPPNEAGRLEALRRHEILDTPPERELDDLVLLAAHICGTPISLVSLVDADRQWFKAKVGLAASETPRELAFCAQAILGDDLLVVPDASGDPRFAGNELVVGEPNVRFYAGAPLIDRDGFALGTLCVIDRVPRRLSATQEDALRALGRQAAARLEQRRKASELCRSEEALQDLLDNANLLIQMVSPDGRLLRVNRAWRETLGYSEQEAAALGIFDVVAAESRVHCAAVFERALAGELVTGVEALFRAKDGREVLVEGDVSCRIEGGVPVATRGIFVDVTERKRIEEERDRLFVAQLEAAAEAEAARRELAEQNERLLELDRLKDEFVSLVSHEFRTPLTSIVGFVELLLDGSAGKLTGEQRDFLRVVDRSADRLLRLVRDLLFVAQSDAGRLQLELEQVDLEALAAESVKAARPLADDGDIALSLASEPVSSIAGDRARLAQLLDNLVANAIKYTPAGGSVQVRVRSENGSARIEVADTGVGIPADEQELLFDRFYRASTGRSAPGTGLGLAIAKMIAEGHGGSIAVESREGAGATFRVDLPPGSGA